MTKEKEYKKDKGIFAIGLTRKEIRMLCWWATIGIAGSQSGTYQKVIPSLLKCFSKELDFKLPCTPEFNHLWKDNYRLKKKDKYSIQK